MSLGKAENVGKIRSEFLRREAAEAPSEPHVVIVELNLPSPKASAPPPPMNVGSAKRRIVAAVEVGSGDTKKKVSDARKMIEKIIGHKTDAFFPSSSAFVVSATGEQLRSLANLDLVSAIWPNDLTKSTL